MAYATNAIVSRIAWCQQQEKLARTQFELEGWRAEEQGLRDALHYIDQRNQYRDCPARSLPEVCDRVRGWASTDSQHTVPPALAILD